RPDSVYQLGIDRSNGSVTVPHFGEGGPMCRRRILTLVPVAALLTSAAGCGTVLNTLWFTPMEGGQSVYGGVRLDYEAVTRTNKEGDGIKPMARLLMMLDLPFSLIADTLT